MRTRIVMAAGLGVLALAAAAGSAWAAERVAVDIPFAFTVADKEMPAGRYELEATGMQADKLIVRSADGGAIVATVIERLASVGAKEPRVVFDEKDGKYYLSEYHVPGKDGLLVGTIKGEQKHRVIIGK